QALLTELSGLKKPRGFFNRTVRRSLGLKPKDPPKYRILVIMATNMPDSLDPALLRPGRIDRIYRVGYPSKAGRIRTYKGYLDKVSHSLTEEQVDRLATITPYATGATIKDLVNESLIIAIRDGRDSITWRDVIRAKQLKAFGPPDDVEYIERERHAVAVHEACHAVASAKVRNRMAIDIATIEKASNFLGVVASIPTEDLFTKWRSEYEVDIMSALASLAGERLFFEGDNSSGVSGDLEAATAVATMMEGYWGMGSTISSHAVAQRTGTGPSRPTGRGPGGRRDEKPVPQVLSDRIEAKLDELYRRVRDLLEDNRSNVLAVAHALETYKTITGEDITAIIDGHRGPIVDGRAYADPEFMAEIERYHVSVVDAHRQHRPVTTPLPEAPVGFRAGAVAAQAELTTGELALGSGHPMSANEDE
ncbi:MAG: AAA family ATPase, partial [Actinomycetota bacterium]|nr:AAA family ATPase [Actinomycetota bacterium]